MSRAKNNLFGSLILVFIGLAGIACAKKGEKAVDAKHLLESRCSTCHFSTDVYTKIKTPEQWKLTVERMRQTNPNIITAEEGALITAYLQKQASKNPEPKAN